MLEFQRVGDPFGWDNPIWIEAIYKYYDMPLNLTHISDTYTVYQL